MDYKNAKITLMIYLIGGPPRTGKTYLAKKFAKKLKIPWISTDTLEVMSRVYIPKTQWKKTYPYTFLRRKKGARDNDEFYSLYPKQKIIQVLKKQAKAAYKAIEMMVACEIDNGNDYIIEGYHLVPSFVHRLIRKYDKKNIKAIFLTKFDAEKFAIDVHKSDTPNDWLLVLTKKPETFIKVGEMVAAYSRYFEKEAKKFKFKVLNVDHYFKEQMNNGIRLLS